MPGDERDDVADGNRTDERNDVDEGEGGDVAAGDRDGSADPAVETGTDHGFQFGTDAEHDAGGTAGGTADAGETADAAGTADPAAAPDPSANVGTAYGSARGPVADLDVVGVGLVALFVTSLVTAQLLAVKIVTLDLPVAVPVIGPEILVPAGVIAYAATFLATDCLTELYGHRYAATVVNVGFGMILVMLALVWAAILAPASPAGVDQGAFAAVMAPSTNIVLGGLLAYVLSQNWDVFAFDRIRRYTGRRLLWVRNLGSTLSSQAIDTVVFISVAFWLAPTLLGIGEALPGVVIASLILGQYVLKLAIALLDTPLVYLVVGGVRRYDPPGAAVTR